MTSYLLEYDIIFIRIWHHIYWDMASYILEYGIIFIEMWHHIYGNMASYLLQYDIIFIGIRNHFYWNHFYTFRYLNVLKKLQHSPWQFVATTHAWNYKKIKFCRLSLLSLVARTRPVGTLSVISINFAKWKFDATRAHARTRCRFLCVHTLILVDRETATCINC